MSAACTIYGSRVHDRAVYDIVSETSTVPVGVTGYVTPMKSDPAAFAIRE